MRRLLVVALLLGWGRPLLADAPLLLDARARDNVAALARKQPNARATAKAVQEVGELALTARMERPTRVAALARAYAVAGDKRFLKPLTASLVDWAKTDLAADPATEATLVEAAGAYATARTAMPARSRKLVDRWLREIGQRAMTAGEATVDPARPKTQLDAQRVRLVGAIGFLLSDQPMVDWMLSAYGLFVAGGITAGQPAPVATLEPLVALAVDAAGLGIGIAGTDLFRYQGESGASLRSATAEILRGTPAAERPGAARLLGLAAYFEPKWEATAARWRAPEESLDGAWVSLVIEALQTPPPAKQKASKKKAKRKATKRKGRP